MKTVVSILLLGCMTSSLRGRDGVGAKMEYLERHPITDCIAVLTFTITNGLRFWLIESVKNIMVASLKFKFLFLFPIKL